MNLECRIMNPTNLTYPNLLIKKYRQIVFINKQEIVLYTALVVGAKSKQGTLMGEPLNRFWLEIDFDLTDDTLKTHGIFSENRKNEFFSEIDRINDVWGDGCRELQDQQQVCRELQGIWQGDDFKVENNKIDMSRKYLFIPSEDEQGKGIVACESQVESKDNGYKITPFSELHRGVDLLSWVKTTISFEGNISPNEEINIRLTFPQSANTESTELSYISFYICPMEGYHIADDSKVTYTLSGNRSNEDTSNNLSKVTQNNSLYYDEWVDRYGIRERYVYRLYHEKLFDNLTKPIDNCREISINCRLNPDTEKGSVQFIMGAIWSAAITYGVDSGRISDVESFYLPVLPADIQWYIVCAVLFVAFVRWCSRRDKVHVDFKDKLVGFCGKVGLFMLVCWFAVVYILGRTEVLIAYLKNLNIMDLFIIISRCLFLLGMGSVLSYIVLTWTLLRNHYNKYPFSRDIIF